MNQKNYAKAIFIVLLNLILLIPFVLIWTGFFILVFLGISGVLGGLFLFISYMTAFRVNIIPITIYEHAMLLFAYVFFFIGIGGLLLTVMSWLVPWFLNLVKQYYQWNLTMIGGNADEK